MRHRKSHRAVALSISAVSEMLASSQPNGSLDAPPQGRSGRAGLSQAVRRTPEARSCTNAVRKRAGLIYPARADRTGHKERTTWLAG
jgi:hypothetical protein